MQALREEMHASLKDVGLLINEDVCKQMIESGVTIDWVKGDEDTTKYLELLGHNHTRKLLSLFREQDAIEKQLDVEEKNSSYFNNCISDLTKGLTTQS